MHILYLILAFTAGMLTILFWQVFVRGRVMNWYYGAALILGALADVGCQLWLDIRRLLPWKRFNSRYPGHQRDAEDIY
jgi:hypothetical protein